MKSKHLFFAVACATAFASCTNEELFENSPIQNGEFKRATFENVTIKTSEADTRVVYGGEGYKWENSDEMAALLMDENNPGIGSATFPYAWEQLSWNEKFHLVDYVHTNFKFAYNEGVWSATGDLNMLEGNYFLVAPFCHFNSNRQAYYEIRTQEQVGNTKEARAAAYADNQIFVGYGRLQAGVAGEEDKSGASVIQTKMAAVLSPIRINIQGKIVNPVQVKKIVLRHPSFASQMTIDPTRAPYFVWNMNADKSNQVREGYLFNYANYLTATGIEDAKKELYSHEYFGSECPDDYVWNAYCVGDITNKWDVRYKDYDENNRSWTKYYWDDAIRQVAQPLWEFNDSENKTGYIEVYTKDNAEAAGMELSKDNELGIIAMIPTWNGGFFGFGGEEPIIMEIHTDKGVVCDIDLSRQADPEKEVQTVGSIVMAHPNMPLSSKTVTVILEDEDINAVASFLNINNADDLNNMVDWASQYTTTQPLNAFLHNSVVIDDALAAKIKALMAKNNSLLTIRSVGEIGNNVKFATTEAQADILEYIELMGEYTVAEIVKGGVIDLTEAAHNFLHGKGLVKPLTIQVNKGGTLNIKDNNKNVGGWGVQGDINVYYDVTVNNEGTINVDAKNVAGIYLYNKGTMNLNGGSSIFLAPKNGEDAEMFSTNDIKGTINVAEGAKLSGTTANNIENYGLINNNGEIYNVANYDNDKDGVDCIKPGTIDIQNGSTVTHLTINLGKVIYTKLSETNHVELVKENEEESAKRGIFVYTYTEGKAVCEKTLAKAYVTDLTVKAGYFSEDLAGDAKTNLRHVVMANGTEIRHSSVGDGKIFFAADADEKYEPYFFDATGTIIDGASLYGGVNYVIKGLGNKWKNTFGFYDATGEVAQVNLSAAEVTVNSGATVTTGYINSILKNSHIQNDGTINATGYDKENIQVTHNAINY
ncbi:MAG: hypothetical protein Q4F52_10625 [Bacteroidaceae bacterium]|nr:hypothetical protein [Bacteroidaceae bacterium]